MSYAYPEYLWLFLVLFPVFFILLRGYIRGRRQIIALEGTDQSLLVNLYTVKYIVNGLLILLAITTLVLAVSGITWGEAPEEDNRSQIDLLFVLDVSRSMLAQDVQPNRLEKAKSLIRAVSASLQPARFGLIAMAGQSYEVVPLTESYDAFIEVLDSLDPWDFTRQGTRIDLALALAQKVYEQRSNRFPHILLLSDGEESGDLLSQGYGNVVDEDVPIYSFLVGTGEGATIPTQDGSLVNGEGAIVITRADGRALELASEISSGAFYDGEGGDPASEAIAAISDRVQGQRSTGFRLSRVPRYGLFVSITMILLMASLILRVIPLKSRL